MDNFTIEKCFNLLFRNSRNKINYYVIAKDQFNLVSFNKKITIICCNTGTMNSGGFHWVGIFVINIRNKYYVDSFDSFGKTLSYYDITLPINVYRIKENNKSLQSVSAESCGKYTIYFLYKRVRGVSLKNIVNSFYFSVNCNEQKIERFFVYIKKLIR